MLKHCVFLDFRDDVDPQERDRVLAGLGALMSEVDGMIDYVHGPNLDLEAKSPDYDHGFIVTFRDRAASQAYAAHPEHVRLGRELVQMCNGGHAGIIVFDLEMNGAD